MLLSDHFTLEELQVSDIALRQGIDNTPPPEVVPYLTALCVNVLEPARTLVGIYHVTSGFRCLTVNRLLGSSDNSQHPKGQAADCIPKQMSPLEMAQAIARSPIPFDQMIWEFRTWVHLSYDPDKTEQRREVLTAVRGPDGKTQYLPGLVE